MKAEVYAVNLALLWLSSPELAVQRVADRVAFGGHDVPREVVVRRYARGLRNFFSLYRPMASAWRFYDASGPGPQLLAEQVELEPVQVHDRQTRARIAAPHQL